MKPIIKKLISVIVVLSLLFAFNTSIYSQSLSKRNVISLNGTWQIAEGEKDIIPESFTHTVQVPGLVSLAYPEFKDVAPKVKDRGKLSQSDSDTFHSSTNRSGYNQKKSSGSIKYWEFE